MYSWPPDRAVWPNDEVVLFQPWSGPALSLGSATNFKSYLSLPTVSTIFWIFPRRPPCPYSPPSATLILICTALFAPYPPPSLPVFYRLFTWKSIHFLRPPLPVPALSVVLPSTCSPGTSQPPHPRAASLFLPSLPLSVRPPFSALNVTINPYADQYLVLSLFHHRHYSDQSRKINFLGRVSPLWIESWMVVWMV